MSGPEPARDQERWRKNIGRIAGSMPWLKPTQKQQFRVKVFKSGNSVALRLPAGLGLQPGMEMDLEVEDGTFFSFEPVDRPKRKFDVDSIWGIEPGLEPIRPEDRLFEERRFATMDSPGSAEPDT